MCRSFQGPPCGLKVYSGLLLLGVGETHLATVPSIEPVLSHSLSWLLLYLCNRDLTDSTWRNGLSGFMVEERFQSPETGMEWWSSLLVAVRVWSKGCSHH